MAEPEAIQTRVRSVLEDPSAQVIANVYADSFLTAAEKASVEGGMHGALEEFTSFMDDVLKAHPQLREILSSRIIKRDRKLGLINRVVGPHGSPFFTNFLRVLCQHERLNLLPVILQQTWRKYEFRSGRRPVGIRSAKPLSEAVLNQVRQQLTASLPFEPILKPEVDESLLGGLVIEIGDTVYDTSLRTRVNQLRDNLRRRSQNEVQRQRDRFVTG
jgi:F-type H+-transporting ATPase subunit delta